MSAWSRHLVDAAMGPDVDWEKFAVDHDPVMLATEIKRVIKDIGQQEMHRAQGLGLLRDDPDVSDADYETAKRGLRLWKRSVAQVRQRLHLRLAEVQPRAQAVIDAHQADRRTLVVLAKRIWLWEEGLEDQLEDALDNFTISESVGGTVYDRKPLRQLVEEIRAAGGEITP